MTSLTLAIPNELKEEMDKHPDINWSAVARISIQRKLELLKKMDELLKNSELTEEDTIRLGRELNERVAKRYEKLFKEKKE